MKVEVITSNVLVLPPRLGPPLHNVCVTNDRGYVWFVVITIRSFTHSWFITGFVITWVSHVEHDLVTHPEHMSSP